MTILRDTQEESAETRAVFPIRPQQIPSLLVDAIESMKEGFAVFDSEDRLLLCNQQYKAIYPRITTLIVPGVRFNELVTAATQRGQIEEVSDQKSSIPRLAVWENGSLLEYRTSEGRWIEARDYWTEGEGRVSIRVDITEHKRAEETIFAQKERAEVTLTSIGDAVVTTDAEGVVEYLNPMAEMLTGWTVDEARGQPLDTVFHIIDEHSRERAQNPLTVCLGQGAATRQANYTVLLSRAGHECAIQKTESLIRSREGQILGLVLVFSDITEARQVAQQLAHDATHDALTGLVNRREFESRLQRLVEMVQTQKTEHALCYLDLDQFKIINDTCGHAAGDEILCQVADLMRGHIRQRDTIARLGGDEFGVLMEHCTLEQALRVADALCQTVEEFRFVQGDKKFSVGASIGLVSVTKASRDITDVLRAADNACYTAKNKGRKRIHVYREDDAELATRRGEMQWVERIKHALEEDRFHLNFQPIVPINGGDTGQEHYELLLRLDDEDGHIVRPSAFLPAAERSNLATQIDRWVVRTAFEWFTLHPERLEHLFLCAINLSGHSLGDKEFLESLVRQFDEVNISPEKICFEITETAAITNFVGATRFIETLKELGCRFALDDFGSGLSSFAYLKNLPVDFLKIDGVFVRDILDNPIDLAMVKSINEIGHAMGKQTIAEFVENDAILDELRLGELGVNYAQGYAIGHPRPINEMH